MGEVAGWLVAALVATAVYWSIAVVAGVFFNLPILVIATVFDLVTFYRRGGFDPPIRGKRGFLDWLNVLYWFSPVSIAWFTAGYVRGWWQFPQIVQLIKTTFLR